MRLRVFRFITGLNLGLVSFPLGAKLAPTVKVSTCAPVVMALFHYRGSRRKAVLSAGLRWEEGPSWEEGREGGCSMLMEWEEQDHQKSEATSMEC